VRNDGIPVGSGNLKRTVVAPHVYVLAQMPLEILLLTFGAKTLEKLAEPA
jgi:hypothetical protein